MARTITEDVDRVQELVGALRGRAVGEVEAALSENRDGVMRLAAETARNHRLTNPPAAFVASVRKGEHKRRLRVMSTDETTGTARRTRIPAAEALRRLYDAKAEHLAKLGVRDPERTWDAVDYACGEIWRCDIEPMPEGGLPKLEDDLYRAIGFDRVTGLRGSPLPPSETRA